MPTSESGTATLGNDGRRNAAQKKKNHHHHQPDRQQQFEFDVLHRSPDCRGEVGQGAHLYRSGQGGSELRQQFLNLVHHRDGVRAGLALDVHNDGGNLIHPRGLADVLDIILDCCHVGQLDGRAVLIRDHQTRIVFARKQLVVRADLIRLVLAVEIPFGLVDICRDERGTKVFQIHAVGRQLRGIGLNPHGWFLAAADAHQTDAWQLRNLRGQPRIGQIFHLRKRRFIRCQRQGEDRRVGGIRFRVDRRHRQIRRQIRPRSVDRLLHFLLGDIDVEAERELQRNDRTAIGTDGGHLLQPGNLAELPLERRGHGRRHHIRTRARIERHDLNDRIINLRQRGYRQLTVSNDPREQDSDHQQRRRYGPQNECA